MAELNIDLTYEELLSREGLKSEDVGELYLMLPDGQVQLWWTCGVVNGQQMYRLRQEYCWAPTSGMLRKRAQP